MSRVAIFGSNPAALSAAIRLAIKGHEVTVVETAEHVWPSSTNNSNYITLPAALRDLFLKSGSSLEDNVELRECDIAYSATLASGKVVHIPGFGVSAVSRTIKDALGDHVARDWDDYIRQSSLVWEKLHKTLENYQECSQVVHKLTRRTLFRSAVPQVKNRALKTIRAASPFFQSESPNELLNAVMPYVQATFGTFEVVGGIHVLAQAFQQRCVDHGVTLKIGDNVASIQINDSMVDIIFSAGVTESFDLVVITEDSVLTHPLLDQYGKPHSQTRYDMTTRHPHIFVAGELSLPGFGIAFETLSGAMVANFIGTSA